MKQFICAALGVAGLAAVGAPADAANVVVTYTGKVNQGIDIDGLFGDAGADLTRTAYSLSFAADTSGFYSDGIDGEYSMIGYCCSVAATMTIGGRSYTIDGSSAQTTIAQWAAPAWGYGYQINAEADAANGDWTNASVASLDDFFGGLNLLTPLSHTVSNDDATSAIFSGGNTWLDLRVSTVSVATANVPAPAPEPASWAMMIGGFGLIGTVLRRNRRTTVRFA